MVTYIHTADPKFLSPSGKRVGEILEANFSQIVRAPGFEMYGGGPIRGWTAVVGFNGKGDGFGEAPTLLQGLSAREEFFLRRTRSGQKQEAEQVRHGSAT